LDDAAADAVLANLEKAMRKDSPWSSSLFMQLDRLRSFRVSPSQIQKMQRIAQMLTVKDRKPSREKSDAAKQAFEQGNRQYEAGRFLQAIESYRISLKNRSAHWDAWNNMALAEMHANNDLVSLFLLWSLIKNNPSYTGGAVNLSACLERLGQDDLAYETAVALVSGREQIPMLQYNLAWFENLRGDYQSASTRLAQALTTELDYPAARWLRALNSMESGNSITAEELLAFPQRDRSLGIPKILTKSVKASSADAYSGKDAAAHIPAESRLLISQEDGDWCAVYWPVENVKRRLWVNKEVFGDTALSRPAMIVPRIYIPGDIDFYIVHTADRIQDAKKSAERLREHGFTVSLKQISNSLTGGASKCKIFSEAAYRDLALKIAEIVADIEPVAWKRGSEQFEDFKSKDISIWIVK